MANLNVFRTCRHRKAARKNEESDKSALDAFGPSAAARADGDPPSSKFKVNIFDTWKQSQGLKGSSIRAWIPAGGSVTHDLLPQGDSWKDKRTEGCLRGAWAEYESGFRVLNEVH